MSRGKIWRSLTQNRARTHPNHPDTGLRGRTYAIPFNRVWREVLELASGGLWGWSLVHADEDEGVVEAESATLVFRFVDDVRIRVSLDSDAQTRVDMSSASRKGKGDLGTNARRIRRFFKNLDRRLEAGPDTILESRARPGGATVPGLLLLLAMSLPVGCEPDSTGGEGEAEEFADTADTVRNFQGRAYERHIVFLSQGTDSAVLLPLSFRARTRPGEVEREIRGWLVRNGAWDPLLRESWSDRPTRVPWRILPRGPIRLVVGVEDALENIIYQDGGRSLEVALGNLLVEWSGPRAQIFRVHEGVALLREEGMQGLILDLSRARAPTDRPPEDWAFLVAGDSLQMILESTGLDADGRPGPFSAWARVSFTDRQWQGIRMNWSEIRAYEPARRDVPMGWEITSFSGDLSGTLSTVAPYLEAGDGEGPVLPVQALFLVEGTVVIEGQSYTVRGLLHHKQR